MPQMSSCSNYVYPNTTSDLKMICAMQSSEPGCDVYSKCNDGDLRGEYCDGFSILADLCDTKLNTLSGVMGRCDNYRSMCGREDTQIKACGKFIPNLVSKDDAVSYVREMCDSGMSGMKACSECPDVSSCPHPLLSMSEMCLEMPGMSRCDYLWTMCQNLGDGFVSLCGDASRDQDDEPYCKGTGTNMMMSGFTWVPKGSNPCMILFFESWLIDSDFKLVISLFGVFILGVLNSFANQYRDYVWKWWHKKNRGKNDTTLSYLIHTSLGALQLSIGYLLMLVAMTYVFVYFAAAVLGLAFGQVIVASRSGAVSLNAAQIDSCCGSLRSGTMNSTDLEKYVAVIDDDEEIGENFEEIKLEIEGMTCASCVQTVRSALSNVSGVRSVAVILGSPKSYATIRHLGVRNDTNIFLQAVENVGFDAVLSKGQ